MREARRDHITRFYHTFLRMGLSDERSKQKSLFSGQYSLLQGWR